MLNNPPIDPHRQGVVVTFSRAERKGKTKDLVPPPLLIRELMTVTGTMTMRTGS